MSNNNFSDYSDDDCTPWDDTESSSLYGDDDDLLLAPDELMEEEETIKTSSSIHKPLIDKIHLDAQKEYEMTRQLKVLPRPVFRCSWKTDGDEHVSDNDMDSESCCSSTASSVSASPAPIISPWKKIEPPSIEEDPWKFLTPVTPPSSPRRRPSHRDHHHRDRDHHQGGGGRNNVHHNNNNNNGYGQNRNHHHNGNGNGNNRTNHQNHHESSKIDNSDTNKLCKYKKDCRMNEHGKCTMVHDLSEWKPRICRFDTRCKRKNQCGYHHHDVPIHVYLSQMIKRKESVYHKNAALYSKYLHH